MSRGNTRIKLGELEDSHIARFIELSDDPELIRTMGWRPFAPGEKDRFFETTMILSLPGCDGGETKFFSIIIEADNSAVGYVIIKGIDPETDCAEIGIAIMDKDYRGRGIGGKALWLAGEYAFGELGLNMLGLTVFPENGHAINTYQKLGFKKQELLRDSWRMPDGTYTDMWLMELEKDDAGSGVDPARCADCRKRNDCSRRK
jgi:RimJ/RimL family protein N-acetyltransferase